MDFATGRCGLTALHVYWKSTERQLQEVMLHFQLGMPLVNKNYVKVPPTEQKHQRVEVVVSADVRLPSAYALRVNDNESELELLWWIRSWMKTCVRC